MSNIDEVKSTLRKYLKKGQEIILFDDAKPQSLIGQYMIFNKAQMILGTHGGGLANILWSTIGTKVIEVLPVTPAKDSDVLEYAMHQSPALSEWIYNDTS